MINVAKALAGGTQRFMPENLAITGGGGEGGLGIGPLVPQLMRFLQAWDKRSEDDHGRGEAPQEPAATPVSGWSITPSVTSANIAAQR